MQSRRFSFYEALANLIIGFTLNVVVNASWVIFFLGLGGYEALKFGGSLAVIFVLISLIRSYIIRRIFNQWENRANKLR